MNPWFGKAVFIAGFFAIGYIRDPHLKRNRNLKVARDRKSGFDYALLGIVTLGQVVLPALWMIVDIFPFADYPLHPFSFGAGLIIYATGFWLFNRSHDDLGTNWSVTLEIRENHSLVKEGVYKYIRHPMYSSLSLYSAGQVFFLPNWIVGPAGLLSFALLYFLRVPSEERMMVEAFGDEYHAYAKSTKRLVPGLW
jgi:protein-S-isoprenylcysteine O-methyltransferase Ste14